MFWKCSGSRWKKNVFIWQGSRELIFFRQILCWLLQQIHVLAEWLLVPNVPVRPGRVGIIMEAPKVEYEELTGKGTGMDSRTMRGKVMLARMRQMDRFREEKLTKNAQMGQNEIEKYCRLGKEEERMMRQAYEVMKLTVRSYHKVLKVARTIADMEEKEEIDLVTLREALGYRVMDKEYWG